MNVIVIYLISLLHLHTGLSTARSESWKSVSEVQWMYSLGTKSPDFGIQWGVYRPFQLCSAAISGGLNDPQRSTPTPTIP